jgi:hypothetical protein
MVKKSAKAMGIWKYKFVLNTFRSNETALPDAIIIGAQKAATTSLFHYLTQHPAIKGSRYKEVHFFDRETRYRRGLTWYKRQFPWRGQAEILLESTPEYLYLPKVPKRLSRLNKQMKFIVTIREPISRAISAWNMYRRKRHEKRFVERMRSRGRRQSGFRMYEVICEGDYPSFEEMAELELQWIEHGKSIIEPSILRRGFYEEQIRRWYAVFSREQFFFVRRKDLQYPALPRTLNAIEQFFGIQSDFNWEEIDYEEKNVLRPKLKTRDIAPGLYRRLKKIYSRRNRHLSQLTGLSFDWLQEDQDIKIKT